MNVIRELDEIQFKIATIGVYGFNETEFFETLQKAKIDVFCDIRLHRGMRGAKYSFVNSQRLQDRLQELGIHYIHLKNLAPSRNIRNSQKNIDESNGINKQLRTKLSDDFILSYEKECLSEFDVGHFLSQIGNDAHKIVLFCVEREPLACHRSLVATRLSNECNIKVEHLKP